MDTITHVVLGACIGEVFVGKKIGKRALLLGALAQSVPDIDFIASFFLNPVDDLLAHRGFTHSLLFCMLVVPVLAAFADRWCKPHTVSFKTWLWFFATEVSVHLILDTANAYGTGLLEPFNHLRFSYNTLFVADPFFSIVPGMVAILLLTNKTHKKRTLWAIVSLTWCVGYFLIAIINKSIIERSVKSIAIKEQVSYCRHFTTPTPFNNLLWYIVLENDSGYYIGYRSVLDTTRSIDFAYYKKNKELLKDVIGRNDIRELIRFSQGYYTVEKQQDTLIFHDLRFGQIAGWNDIKAPFAFYYYVNNINDNNLLVQRGRLQNWNTKTIGSLWRRMMGN
jgi:inner membrane protein